MKKIILIIFFAVSTFVISSKVANAIMCGGGYTGGLEVVSCGWISPCQGCQSYCDQYGAERKCTCPSGNVASCSCEVTGGDCIQSGAGPQQICTCSTTGLACSHSGQACATGIYPAGTCLCDTVAPGGSCSLQTKQITLWCNSMEPTATPGPAPTSGPSPTWTVLPTNTPSPTPTNTPTPTPTSTPTPTPTPVIVGNIYYDNDDGTIQVVGGMCARIGGLQPTPQVVTNASVNAIKSSNGTISPGTILGSTFTIVTNLVKGATDYRVQLALPTPAPDQAVAYTCGCPVTAGQEYLCEYTGVAADSTVNFFVKENNLADPWWQAVGGNVFAKYQVRSKVPVSTCDADPNCDSGVITGPTNANFSGFIAVGETGSVSTTKDNSTAYVNAANTRTTSQGAFAVGAQQMVENYDTFYGNVSRQLVSVTSLNDLVTKIAAQATNTTGLYLYTSGDLTIDKSGAAVPLAIPADKRVVVFVPGNLQITNSSALDAPRIVTVANGGFLMFIVRSNITVAAEVGHISNTVVPTTSNPNIEGVYFANGQITVASDGSATTSDRKLIAAGTFVGLDTGNVGNGINLLRNFDDGGLGKTKNSVAPTEVFMFRPDFVDNYPVELKTASYNWKELAPQR